MPDLKPGDLLVFSRRTIFDWAVRVKTWSVATHTEVYIGGGKTVASRNGKGCAVYLEDLDGLYCVLRPTCKLDIGAGLSTYYAKWDGKPYGWLALFEFCLIDLHSRGIFCSELSTMFLRACGCEPFNELIDADMVSPGNCLYVPRCVMELAWIRESR